MKKIFNIFIMLVLLFTFTGCKGKYSTIYCDFHTGDFNSKGYYIIKSKDELSKFRSDHTVTAEFTNKLKYDKDYFNNKYLIILIMPAEENNVSYELKHVNFDKSTLNVEIKMLNKTIDTKPEDNKPTVETNPGDVTNPDDNNQNNDSIIDNISDSIMDGNDNNSSDNGNNNGSVDGENNGSDSTDKPNDDNNGSDSTDKPNDDNNGSDSTDKPNEDSKMLVNKGYVLELNKKNMITTINLKIV